MKSAFEKLNLKYQKFVQEYSLDFNGSRAVTEVGYRGKPEVIAARLLARPDIKAALAEVIKPSMDLANVTRDDILKQLARFAFCNPWKYVDSQGYLKCSLAELPEDVQQAIVEYTVVEKTDKDGNVMSTQLKVKFVSKLGATEMLAKYHGILTEGAQINIDARGIDAKSVADFWKDFHGRGITPPQDVIEAKFKELKG